MNSAISLEEKDFATGELTSGVVSCDKAVGNPADV
jgi:hypothetical protein